MGCKEMWGKLWAEMCTGKSPLNWLNLGVTTAAVTLMAIQCAENDEMVGVSATTLALEGASELLSGILILANKKIQESKVGAWLRGISAITATGAGLAKVYALGFEHSEWSGLEKATIAVAAANIPISIGSALVACSSLKADANRAAAQQARAADLRDPAAVALINSAQGAREHLPANSSGC